MSVNTNLLISNQYRVSQIIELIEYCAGTKGNIEETYTPDYHILNIKIDNEQRSISIFTNHRTPIGPAMFLSFRSNFQGIAFFRKLAAQVGGFLVEQDCDGKLEEIQGQLDEEK